MLTKPRYLQYQELNPLFEPIAGSPSSLSQERQGVLANLIQYTTKTFSDGNLLELGVYQGHSAKLILQTLQKLHKLHLFNLYLLDTFQGILPSSVSPYDLHQIGEFQNTSVETVQQNLEELLTYTVLIPGEFPETFKLIENIPLHFIHLDVDLYLPTSAACRLLWPQLQLHGIMLVDDYGLSSCPGVAKAINEYFQNSPYTPIYTSTGQAILFKSC